jgi:hypothetical protein
MHSPNQPTQADLVPIIQNIINHVDAVHPSKISKATFVLAAIVGYPVGCPFLPDVFGFFRPFPWCSQ